MYNAGRVIGTPTSYWEDLEFKSQPGYQDIDMFERRDVRKKKLYDCFVCDCVNDPSLCLIWTVHTCQMRRATDICDSPVHCASQL